ncbi:hypothetical protein BFW01_g7601 [Lasiodiplodia theobromae]|nr:hypothetical protein BFW01_g7601 [Lasiodiplodia theobromae]
MTNPLMRTDRCYVSIIPLIASVGIQDLPALRINGEQSRYALIEAARNGHGEIVQRLLDTIEIDNEIAETTLLAACSHGDEQLLISLINRLGSLNAFTLPPFLLNRASWLGQQQLAKLLIDRDVALTANEHTFLRQTPLHHAARHGHTEIAELVLARDPSLVSTLAKGEWSPLKFAAMYGHPALVRLLLAHGADKDPRTANVGTPLANACVGGLHAAARVLLDAGVDPNLAEPTTGQTPLVVAAGYKRERCVRLLLDHGADVQVDSPHGTALYRAVINKHADVCRLLLNRGASANCSGDQGPALGVTVRNKDMEVVKLLVEHGADVNGLIDDGAHTILYRAILTKGSLEIIRYLLDNGAEINSIRSGKRLLWRSIFGDDAEIVRLLIKKGADVNFTISDGWTPLHASYENAVMTKILLEAGASVDRLRNGNGESALFLASWYNQPDVVQILLGHNAQVDLRCRTPDDAEFTALYCATVNGHAKVARILLEAGADVNYHDKSASVLHAAAMHGEEILRTLLEFRPDIAVRTPSGKTALHYYSLPLACAKILVHSGLHIELTESAGYTPLCFAVRCDNLEVARFLLAKGASVAVSTKDHGSPLHLACSYGSLQGVKMLVAAGADIHRSHPDAGTPVYAACTRPVPSQESWEQYDSCTRDVLEYLLHGCEEKPDVNQPGGKLGFALSAACAFCSVATIDALLDAGARVDVHDAFGRHPG